MYFTAPKVPIELLGFPKRVMDKGIDETISGHYDAPDLHEESLINREKNKFI